MSNSHIHIQSIPTKRSRAAMFVNLRGTGKTQVVTDALFYVGQQTVGIKSR